MKSDYCLSVLAAQADFCARRKRPIDPGGSLVAAVAPVAAVVVEWQPPVDIQLRADYLRLAANELAPTAALTWSRLFSTL